LSLVYVNFQLYAPSLDAFLIAELSFEFLGTGNVTPRKLDVLFFKPYDAQTSQEKLLLICILIKGLFCGYSLWLIYLKLQYKSVLKGIMASIARDVVQMTLSLLPVIMFMFENSP